MHNYSDHVCQDILKRVAQAMSPKPRLLIVGAVLSAQVEVSGDMGGYLIDVRDEISSSRLTFECLNGFLDFGA